MASPTLPSVEAPSRLPVFALVLMAMTSFIVIMTETLPAGLLPQLVASFEVSEGTAGQLVSAYALGTVLAAIPAIAITQGMPRKPLLAIGLLGFIVANTLTALAPTLAVALIARFIGGAFSGLLWGMLAGYARRISDPRSAGKALAIAMTGTPVALSVGTPLGTMVGSMIGWRWTFAAISAVTLLVVVLVLVVVPNAPGSSSEKRLPLHRVAAIPGVAAILGVVFTWMLAHNFLYTYIAPYLSQTDVGMRPDTALFIFGVAALVGIWITGALIDRALRGLVLAGTSLFIVSGLVLLFAGGALITTSLALVIWGLAFGGAATQLQTAMGNASKDSMDVANAMLTTVFNLAIFGGGAVGALLVDNLGAIALPVSMVALSAVALALAASSRRHAFPS
ncbi:MFS transporter [Spiractinospora alimapuensis]|uniref:MFS transporter n=1 Tax=Spiractinospora alimapuensis TaxID=2820884 RepID=UPI001F3770DD|nr:MFS transporter [Spiractinospora alimapuensis]QVQ53738.1 MFS transporter [Spiractinospora alimapuensis]